jgi:hypothetical protein
VNMPSQWPCFSPARHEALHKSPVTHGHNNSLIWTSGVVYSDDRRGS